MQYKLWRRSFRYVSRTMHLSSRGAMTVRVEGVWGRSSPLPRSVCLSLSLHRDGITHNALQVSRGVVVTIATIHWKLFFHAITCSLRSSMPLYHQALSILPLERSQSSIVIYVMYLLYMLYICYIYVIYMLYICYIYVIYMLYMLYICYIC
jgi:hypothetical protein